MEVLVLENARQLGAAAGERAAEAIRAALNRHKEVNIILATGASQFHVLAALVAEPDVDWARVRMFHLDEYIGLPEDHPAGFRTYLDERFVQQVSGLKEAVFVNGGAADPGAECRRLGALITRHPIDVALVGIGENGHLAFNDPPADFDTEEPYIVVALDEACRRQQLGEEWFPSLEAVPTRAISMSIRQIMKSSRIICSVPDRRKAEAVKRTLEGPVENICPASILREHPNCTMLLDEESAALLSKEG